MKVVLETFLLILYFNLNAQIDYTRYHEKIDSAMTVSLYNDFQKSAEIYEDAFSLNKSLLRDVARAISVNLELENWKAVTFFFQKNIRYQNNPSLYLRKTSY